MSKQSGLVTPTKPDKKNQSRWLLLIGFGAVFGLFFRAAITTGSSLMGTFGLRTAGPHPPDPENYYVQAI